MMFFMPAIFTQTVWVSTLKLICVFSMKETYLMAYRQTFAGRFCLLFMFCKVSLKGMVVFVFGNMGVRVAAVRGCGCG